MSALMYWNGGGAWMIFMPLLWIVLIGLIVWAVVRLAHGPGCSDLGRAAPQRETPEEILDRRFASGEIDADGYTEARQRLAVHRSG